MRCDPLDDAVVGIGALVGARQPFDPRIPGQVQRQPVPRSQLFQFRQDAVRDAGDALGIEAVEHASNNVDPVRQAEVEEIGVDEDPVRGGEGGIVGEEEGGGWRRPAVLSIRRLSGRLLGAGSHMTLLICCCFGFFFLLGGLDLVRLDSRVLWTDHPLDRGDLAGFLDLALHVCSLSANLFGL